MLRYYPTTYHNRATQSRAARVRIYPIGGCARRGERGVACKQTGLEERCAETFTSPGASGARRTLNTARQCRVHFSRADCGEGVCVWPVLTGTSVTASASTFDRFLLASSLSTECQLILPPSSPISPTNALPCLATYILTTPTLLRPRLWTRRSFCKQHPPQYAPFEKHSAPPHNTRYPHTTPSRAIPTAAVVAGPSPP